MYNSNVCILGIIIAYHGNGIVHIDNNGNVGIVGIMVMVILEFWVLW